MFCTKCGCAHSGRAAFCTQCGARLTAEEPASEVPKVTTPLTRTEHFLNNCSAIAQKKRKAIKALSIVCLTTQVILNILLIIGLGTLAYALQQSSLFKGGVEGLDAVITLSLIFTVCSFVFTLLGMKKNSTGFFIGATIFAFISTTFGSLNFGCLALRRLIVFGIVAIYIAITALNYQNNKEYKKYLINNRHITKQ